jgi:hypothetical protein
MVVVVVQGVDIGEAGWVELIEMGLIVGGNGLGLFAMGCLGLSGVGWEWLKLVEVGCR